MNYIKHQVMINKAHFNTQEPLTSTNESKEAVLQNKRQLSKVLNPYEVDFLVHYQTAIENGSLEHQILSQRGYNKGYRGF